MSVGSTIRVFLTGAAVGAVAGILLAPDKGENTRRKLSQTAKDFRDEMQGRMKDEFGRLMEYRDKAYSSVSNIVDQAKEEAERSSV